MPTNNNPISVTYSDEKLRILVEEYIAQQKTVFTFRGVCSYILYRAMKEKKTDNVGLYESYQLASADCQRVGGFLKRLLSQYFVKIIETV